jgi:thermitase
MKTQAMFAKIASLSLLGMSLICQAAWAQGQGGNAPPHVPGRILVKFRDGVSDGQARGLLAGRNALSTNVIPELGIHLVQLPPNANEQAEANAFKGLADVEFAEVDAILQPQALTPNDFWYTYGLQWDLPQISAPAAWSITTGSASVTVAVIDSGVDGTHPDLSAKMVPGWNVVDNNSNTSDVTGHGTTVAGVVAPSTNNGIGVAGVCWGCAIMPIRLFDSGGFVAVSAVASGITWAADHGAKVANISYAVTGSSTVSSAAQYFQGKGGVVVAASGDNGAYTSTPDDPYIITVGATADSTNTIYSWSATGPSIDLVAPGCVYTTLPGNSYGSGCGTSYSAPIVAGVAALMFSVNPALSPSEVTNILKQTATDLGAPGCDTTYGCGLVNALAAVTAAAGGGSTKTNTTTALSSSLDPSTPGQLVTFTATVSPSTATGTVTFKDGSTTLGTGTLSSGRATFSTSSLVAGGHSITASYGGSTSYNASTSAILTETLNSTSKTNTTTALGSSLNPSSSGQTVTFTATVSPSTATGTVTFFDGSTSLGSGTLSSGRATLSTASLTAVTHSITASYGGNTSYNGSGSAILLQTVNIVSSTKGHKGHP